MQEMFEDEKMTEQEKAREIAEKIVQDWYADFGAVVLDNRGRTVLTNDIAQALTDYGKQEYERGRQSIIDEVRGKPEPEPPKTMKDKEPLYEK